MNKGALTNSCLPLVALVVDLEEEVKLLQKQN
jgi:hypothetical protein